MIQIVIPMAGRGSRFQKAGYELPKPLIEIHGHPMVEYVVRNVTPSAEHRFIFLCLQEHLDQYPLREALHRMAPGCVIVPVREVTEGAACTVLLAEKYINNDDPLMIANSDQYVDRPIDGYLAALGENDGLIMTLPSQAPNCSYIRYDDDGYVTLVREKEIISPEATVGIYNFARGRDFVRAAKEMIRKNIRTNNEFYLAPVYNEMIDEGKKIVFQNVGRVDENVFGLGIPEDLMKFERNPVSRTVFQS